MKVYVAAYPSMSAVVLAIHARLIARGHTPTASWPTTSTTVQQDAAELHASDVLVVIMREGAAPSPRESAGFAIGITLPAGSVVLFSETAIQAAIANGTVRELERGIDINTLEAIGQAKGFFVAKLAVRT